eukprot:Hpha_TRINITY_DN18409_c0_g1::TRINITY_DN18409_c0_g1_i1::g.165518::m.165518/K10420/DYNLT; dynein light chain Tctex-type 1
MDYSRDEEPPTVTEEVKRAVSSAVQRVFTERLTYQHDKVSQWVDQICQFCIQDCSSLQLKRKYVAHCTIVQRSGAGVHNATSAYWDTETDGYYSQTVMNRNMICTTTLFGVSL